MKMTVNELSGHLHAGAARVDITPERAAAAP